MSSINNGIRQNNITDTSIVKLAQELYENIFNVNTVSKDNKVHYFYNILNKVVIPDGLSSEVYGEFDLDRKMSWTFLSYKIYGTIDLWWLLTLVNKPDYIFMAQGGTSYKYIKQEYIGSILSEVKKQLM